MIRRWSRLTNSNFAPILYSKLYFRFKFKTFRKAIIFKKFFILYSKIIRRHFARMKHSYNWLIYTQIWQHWIQDFLKLKTVTKYLYIKKFSSLEYFSYDPYRFNTKQQKLLSSNLHLSCGLPQSLFFWNTYKNSSTSPLVFSHPIVRNSYLHLSYLLQLPSQFSFNQNFPIPLFFINENNILPINLLNSIENNSIENNYIFSHLFNFILSLIKEIYKININLWLYLIFSSFSTI